MSTLTDAAPAVETRPAVKPIPAETFPDDPNDPFGVDHELIEEIEEIGRKYSEPRK